MYKYNNITFKFKTIFQPLHNYGAYRHERLQISLLRGRYLHQKYTAASRDDFTDNFRAPFLPFFAASPRWFPFSSFCHFQTECIVPRRQTTPLHPSVLYPKGSTPLKVSTILRDNRHAASLTRSCIYSCVHLFTVDVSTGTSAHVHGYTCVRVENKYERGRAGGEGKKKENETGKRISPCSPEMHRRSLFTSRHSPRFFARYCKTKLQYQAHAAVKTKITVTLYSSFNISETFLVNSSAVLARTSFSC